MNIKDSYLLLLLAKRLVLSVACFCLPCVLLFKLSFSDLSFSVKLTKGSSLTALMEDTFEPSSLESARKRVRVNSSSFSFDLAPALLLASNFLRSCVVYDDRTCSHKHPSNDLYMEKPERLEEILVELQALRTRCSFELINLAEKDRGEERKEEEEEEEEDILHKVHTSILLSRLDSLQGMDEDRLLAESEQFVDVFFTPLSFSAARRSCACVSSLAKDVASGRYLNGMALTRPPGHHASSSTPMGFCLLNNVAVAARSLLEDEELGVRKILILDWDVHHGNGTQEIFYGSKDVLFISIHRYDGGRYFPSTTSSSTSSSSSQNQPTSNAGSNSLGSGEGLGFNVNIPLSGTSYGDDDYKYIFNLIVAPLAQRFEPDFVLVSAGFDAAVGDVGEFSLTPPFFGWMTQQLRALAEGKVVLALEGGYRLRKLADCVTHCVEALTAPLPSLDGGYEQEESCMVLEGTVQTIVEVLSNLEPHWPGILPS